MTRPLHVLAGSAIVIAMVTLATEPGDAHKPITSPFTYNEDVFPVLRDRCGACHVAGGIAPMSLMTHEETVPWGESIRVELLAGHMPPWSVETAADRFRNAASMSAREMNLLLTWATGGTPMGDPEKAPAPVTFSTAWPLGPPDLELPFPEAIAIPEDKQEHTVELLIPTGLSAPRRIAAVDLRPGTPSVVRSATVEVAPAPEPLLALWLPGDAPVETNAGSGFELPAGAPLRVRVHYRKTWQYERQAMTDRSTIGLYFADGVSTSIRALALAPDPAAAPERGRLSFSHTLDKDVRALAIYPNDALASSDVTLTAIGPDGARQPLIVFRPRAGWLRRFWFREPIALTRGTRIEARVSLDDEGTALPPSAAPQAPAGLDPSRIRLTLNVVP